MAIPRRQNFRNFAELAHHSPFIQTWGIQCDSEGEGRAVLRMAIRQEHLNSIGTVHGGVIAAIGDTACGIALLSTLPRGRGYVTANLNVNYIGVPKGKVLVAEGRTIAVRKRVAFAEAEIRDEAGALAATVACTFFIGG